MIKPLLLLSVVLSFYSPLAATSVHAQYFGPLIPEECYCENQPNPVPGGPPIVTAPDFGCVLQTMQNGINITVSLAAIGFVLVVVVVGAQLILSGGNPQKIQWARDRVFGVVVGIAVFLCAWLLIDYVMKTVYNPDAKAGEIKLGPWNSILAGDRNNNDRCIVATNPTAITEGVLQIVTGGSGVQTPGAIGVSSGAVLDDGAARKVLTDGGLVIHSWSATRTLSGTRADTVNQAVEVRRACNCRVVVTSTTAGTHSTSGPHTHANGYKIDLDDNPQLDAFLRTLRSGGTRGGDNAGLYYDSCGNEYAREKTHWDIKVHKGVCRL